MPYQGPWSKCNHCNNNMLATHKHNASALFWYTQRYHDPRTEEHGSPAGVTVPNAFSRVTGTRTGPPYHKAPRLGHGPLVLEWWIHWVRVLFDSNLMF